MSDFDALGIVFVPPGRSVPSLGVILVTSWLLQGRSWRTLEASPGASGSALWRSWAALEPPRALGAPRGPILDRFWTDFGALSDTISA